MTRGYATLACTLGLGLVSGCGGGSDEEFDPIPARSVEAILTQLDQVEERCDAGQTGSAQFQVREIEDKVDALPEGIDPDVREALRDGVERLGQLVEADCAEDEPEETDTQPTDTQTETEPETDTQPTETETQPEPEPEPEPTTPPPTTPPPTTPTPPSPGGGAPSPEEGD